MQMPTVCRRVLAIMAGVAIAACSSWASADPPSRVARLGYLAGAVSFSPAGESDWLRATINRPLGTGDRLWTDPDRRARAEIQIGGAMVRMAAGTSLSVLNLDDRIAQFQVTQGSLHVRVWRLEPDQLVEVATPNLAFSLRQPGEYRIDVDPDADATTIFVRQGRGEAYGEDAAYVIDERQPYRFTGTDLRDYQPVGMSRLDEFDLWAGSRDRSYDHSRSARYVSPDVVGYQDLDANGTWRVDASYGNVWIPNRVAAGWAPYSDGHWAWVDPWGWTWIDDAPWGYAVSHYGRWANLQGTWGWVPGPVRSRAYYAPALVAFVGGNNFQLSISSGLVSGVAWFPLAPRDVYRPSYPVSRRYFENINRTNTVINNTVINNQYNNTSVTNVVYANRQVPGAVVALPAAAFVQAQPVSTAGRRISRETIAAQPVVIAAPLAPAEKSIRGAATQGDKPPPRVFERPVVARTAVPAPAAGFAAQRELLSEKPGRPLDAASRKELRREAAAPLPVVKVVLPQSGEVHAVPPPSAAKPDERPRQSQARQELPVAQDKTSLPPKPPETFTQGPAPRGKPGEVGKGEQRVPPAASSPEKPAAATPPMIVPEAAPSREPTVQSAAPRGNVDKRNVVEPAVPSREVPAMDIRDKPEQRGNRGQRESFGAPPPHVVEPKALPAQIPAAAPVVQAPPPRSEPRELPAMQPKAAPLPQVASPAAPSRQPPAADIRGKPEQRDNGGQRESSVLPPTRVAEPKVVYPQIPVPAPAAQMPPQRPAPPPRGEPPATVPAVVSPAERTDEKLRGRKEQPRPDDKRTPEE